MKHEKVAVLALAVITSIAAISECVEQTPSGLGLSSYVRIARRSLRPEGTYL